MDEYLGFADVCADDADLAAFYSDLSENRFGLLMNQYLILRDMYGEVLEYYRWNDTTHVRVTQKSVRSGKYMGTIKPLNPQQVLALDLLYNNDVTVKLLCGCYGSGKDYLMSGAALDLLEKNKYQKIVYVRNNIEVKNSKPIGYLPGTYNDKLMPFAMPLADHLGGVAGLDVMITQGRIELVHLGFLRGRDLRDSIIYVSEGENLTKEHVQLLLGRVGQGSALWINGDWKQTDAKAFETNNGLVTAIRKLKGHPRFGYVKLLKTERSETAAMADLLDE